ncbi:hypothetical protein ACFLUO_04100 [Chloroflexota bacterium]
MKIRMIRTVMVLILVAISILSFPQGVSTATESSGKIAFISDRNGTQDIYVMDADGTNVKQLTNDSAIETTPDWSPNGKEIAFSLGPVYNRDIYVMDADGTNVRLLIAGTRSEEYPVWSPNGKEIAFVCNLGGGDREICVMDADGTNVRNLTDNNAIERAPAWSPNGKEIAFTSDRNGTRDIYVMDADGTNVRNLTNDNAIEFLPDWSPNGKEIAFASGPVDNRDIYVMDADGDNVRQLTENTDYNSFPDWSSNGKEIAFTSDRNGNRDIYVMDADGTNVRRLTENLEGDLMSAWSTGNGHSHSHPEPYTGPLFDAHLHMRNILQWQSESAETLLSYLDREKIDWAIGSLPFPFQPGGPGPMPIIGSIGSRVATLMGPGLALSGLLNEAQLQQYLQPQGLLSGVGELGLWREEYQDITFNSDVMQTIFQAVNESKGIVMIHLSGGREGERPTELAELEPSISSYPDAIFLFHSIGTFDLVAQLMSKYPNVYYSMDFGASFFKGRGVSLQGYDNAESFLAAVNQTSLGYIVERNLQDLAPLLQKYPDRIFWGTDFSEAWHFEEPVTDLVTDISRRFIGQLPANIQEKYAYQNAQRVFGHFLSSNP